MSQVKSKRIASSVVNTPVTVHIQGSSPLSKQETERLLTNFIDNEETRSNQNLLDNSNLATHTGASVSQLKRIQRDLRGLPPLESTTAQSSTTRATPKKHMKFDDEIQDSIPHADDVDFEVNDAIEETKTISKDEKKRLKKEKRKAEKRAKYEK